MEDCWNEFIKETSCTNSDRTSADISRVIHNMKEGKYINIVFLVGAGISIDAGFPVFRGDADFASMLCNDTPPHIIIAHFEISRWMPNLHIFIVLWIVMLIEYTLRISMDLKKTMIGRSIAMED
jgi:hypothetical protein